MTCKLFEELCDGAAARTCPHHGLNGKGCLEYCSDYEVLEEAADRACKPIEQIFCSYMNTVFNYIDRFEEQETEKIHAL
jgi:hypothetical protein